MKKELLFADIKVGMKVMDEDGDIGTVKECSDIHNIFVVFDNEESSTGFYCLEPGCEYGNDKLYYV